MAIWTKNIIGDKDDMEAEARNSPADNLAAATCCAMAVPFFEESDPVFARWCRNSAIEDFQFAIEAMGVMNDGITTERAAMTTVAAMQLYRLTKDRQYLDWGVRYANGIMAGQQMERPDDWTIPLRGFFYEKADKKRTLTYYHQDREYLMVQALSMLLTDAPNHANAPRWKASC